MITLYVITTLRNIFPILKYIVRILYHLYVFIRNKFPPLIAQYITFWRMKYLWHYQIFQRPEKKRSIIASLIAGFIGFACESVSIYLHKKRQKALQKALIVMDNKINLQCNNIIHLENSMVMYSIYNSEILKKLIITVHKMHNSTTLPNEKLFCSKLSSWYTWYLTKDGIGHYAINSVLYLRMLREKYVKMYKEFNSQLYMYAKVIRILSKGYLPISLLTPSKLWEF